MGGAFEKGNIGRAKEVVLGVNAVKVVAVLLKRSWLVVLSSNASKKGTRPADVSLWIEVPPHFKEKVATVLTTPKTAKRPIAT